LYIIGAGCSRNYAEGTTSVPNLASPLDKDFFVMAKKVILHKGIDEMLAIGVDELIWDLYRFYGHDLPRLTNQHDATLLSEENLRVLDDPQLGLESVMTAISIEAELFTKPICSFGHREPNPFPSFKLAPLIELVAVTISEALVGPLCSKHLRLAELLREGDIVISYNYDILMDNALRNQGKLSDGGYLLPFEKVRNGGAWEKPEDKSSAITLLKLHGSLNWMRCTSCDSNLMMRYEKTDHRETSIPEECPKCGIGGEYLERILVPPLLTKDYSDPAINYLWRETNRRLHNTRIDEIVSIGYSLPATDFTSEVLLRMGLEFNRQRRIPLTLVNPNEGVLCRYSMIFGRDKITWKRSLDEYLDA